MNLYKLADEMLAAIRGMYDDGTKYFRDGTESAHVSEVIAETRVELGTPGAALEFEAGREMLARAVYDAFSAPTLIYHHGSGESDYTAVGRIDRWVFLLSASVRLTKALATHLTKRGCSRLVCAGLSLGGWITNLHHPYFDTCDVYNPVFAGAALHDLFTESIYLKLFASSARDAGDRFIRFERQAGIYRPDQMTVIERGHTTGALAYRPLAGHLGRLLRPTTGSDTADKSGTGDTRFGGSA